MGLFPGPALFAWRGLCFVAWAIVTKLVRGGLLGAVVLGVGLGIGCLIGLGLGGGLGVLRWGFGSLGEAEIV